jgi:hypothetical protein
VILYVNVGLKPHAQVKDAMACFMPRSRPALEVRTRRPPSEVRKSRRWPHCAGYEEQISMSIQQNTDHIQSTHIGSLPRPHDLLDLMKAKYTSEPYDQARLDAVIVRSVADAVRKQVECGIEIVSDGEFSKPSPWRRRT